MAELLALIDDFDGAPLPQEMQPEAESIEVRLYCWPCATVHRFALPDVERIVYALGVEIVHQRDSERVVPSRPEDFDPACLLESLRSSRGYYAEHVADGMKKRQCHG